MKAALAAMQVAMRGDSDLSKAAYKVLHTQLACLEKSSLSYFAIMSMHVDESQLQSVFSHIEDDGKILSHIMSIPSVSYPIWGCFPVLNQEFFPNTILATTYVKLMLSAYGDLLKNDPSRGPEDGGTEDGQFLNIYHHYNFVYPCFNSQILWKESDVIYKILTDIMHQGEDGAFFNDEGALKNARMIIDVGYISGEEEVILEEIKKALHDEKFIFYVPLLLALEKYVNRVAS